MIRLFAAPARTLAVNTASTIIQETPDTLTGRLDEPDRLREASHGNTYHTGSLDGMQPRIAFKGVYRVNGAHIREVRAEEHACSRVCMPQTSGGMDQRRDFVC